MKSITEFFSEDEGQGTVEYAILVGMLVVIGIAAILAVSGKIKPIWESIKTTFDTLSPAA